MLGTTISVSAVSNNKYINNDIENKINEIASLNSFKKWEGNKIKLKYMLYDNDGNEKALYFKVFDKKGSDQGYLIFDYKTYDVSEFSLGESPFDSTLEFLIKEKGASKKEIKLIYSENSTYIATISGTEYDLKRIEIPTDEKGSIKEDIKDYLEESSEFQITPMSYDTTEVIISGVTDYNVLDACGSNAGRIIVDYWNRHGYSSLIPQGKSAYWVNSQLYDWMNSWKIPFMDAHATWPSDFKIGLEGYLNYYAPSGVDFVVAMSRDLNGSLDYNNLKSEVNASRPGVILYNDPDKYGLHYVNFVGYSYNPSDRYYIIKDGWPSTAEYVYKNVDGDNSRGIFWKQYLIIPY